MVAVTRRRWTQSAPPPMRGMTPMLRIMSPGRLLVDRGVVVFGQRARRRIDRDQVVPTEFDAVKLGRAAVGVDRGGDQPRRLDVRRAHATGAPSSSIVPVTRQPKSCRRPARHGHRGLRVADGGNAAIASVLPLKTTGKSPEDDTSRVISSRSPIAARHPAAVQVRLSVSGNTSRWCQARFETKMSVSVSPWISGRGGRGHSRTPQPCAPPGVAPLDPADLADAWCRSSSVADRRDLRWPSLALRRLDPHVARSNAVALRITPSAWTWLPSCSTLDAAARDALAELVDM